MTAYITYIDSLNHSVLRKHQINEHTIIPRAGESVFLSVLPNGKTVTYNVEYVACKIKNFPEIDLIHVIVTWQQKGENNERIEY